MKTEDKPYPQVIALIVVFLATIGVIFLGYKHGHMSVAAVYKSLTSFTWEPSPPLEGKRDFSIFSLVSTHCTLATARMTEKTQIDTWRKFSNKSIADNLVKSVAELLDGDVKHYICSDRTTFHEKIVIEYNHSNKDI